jgi:hypothetical protein
MFGISRYCLERLGQLFSQAKIRHIRAGLTEYTSIAMTVTEILLQIASNLKIAREQGIVLNGVVELLRHRADRQNIPARAGNLVP